MSVNLTELVSSRFGERFFSQNEYSEQLKKSPHKHKYIFIHNIYIYTHTAVYKCAHEHEHPQQRWSHTKRTKISYNVQI